MTAQYGAAGLVGILPPPANTTVEPELGVLLEPDVATVVSRLVCQEEPSMSRLLGYVRNVERSLHAFDTARPDTVVFGCTGSTYFMGLEEEQKKFSALGIISAAQAVLAALDALEARRVALLTPHAAWLTEACVAFWRAQGREVTDVQRAEGDDTLRMLDTLKTAGADVVLISCTAIPSLGALAHARTPVPLLSSNLCLAWAATQRLARAPLDRASLKSWLARNARWKGRLAARFPSLSAKAR